MASISYNDIGTALTAADADPNVTPPAAGRIFTMPSRDNRGAFPSALSVAAIFTGGASPTVTATVWVFDEATQSWFSVGTITTAGDRVATAIPNVPARAQATVQITALGGAPTSLTLHAKAI